MSVVDEFETVREGYQFAGIATVEGDNGRNWRSQLWTCTTCAALTFSTDAHTRWHALNTFGLG